MWKEGPCLETSSHQVTIRNKIRKMSVWENQELSNHKWGLGLTPKQALGREPEHTPAQVTGSGNPAQV